VISPKRSIGTLRVPVAVPYCFSWTSMEFVCPPNVTVFDWASVFQK